jgi:hypothetical protein
LTCWHIYLGNAESANEQEDAQSWICGEADQNKQDIRRKVSVDHGPNDSKFFGELMRKYSTDSTEDVTDKPKSYDFSKVNIKLHLVIVGEKGLYNQGTTKCINIKENAQA